MKFNELQVRLYKGGKKVIKIMQSHEEYLNLLLEQCNQEYAIATDARAQGKDPRIEVEIPFTSSKYSRTNSRVDRRTRWKS